MVPNLRPRTVFSSIASSASLGVLGLLLGLVLIPLILLRIGAAEYGVWLLISTLTTYLFQADLGMGSALVRFGSMSHANGDRADLSSTFANSAVWMSCVGFVLAPFVGIASWFLLWSIAAGEIVGSNVVVAFSIYSAILVALIGLRSFAGVLQAVGLWGLEKKFQFVGVVTRTVGTIFCCFWAREVLYIAFVEVCALLVPAFLSAATVVRHKIVDFSRDGVSIARMRLLLSFSVRTFAVGAVGTAIIQVGIIISGILVAPAVAAYYNAILKVYLAVRQVLTWVGEPFLPALSKIVDESLKVRNRRVLSVVFMSGLTGVVACMGLVMLAPQIVGSWLPGAPTGLNLVLCLQIMLIGMAVNSLHIGAISAMNAVGYPGALFRLQVCWLVLTVGFCWLLGSRYGLIGISLGNALPILILEPFYVRRYLRVFKMDWRSWFQKCFAPILVLTSGGLLAPCLVLAIGFLAKLEMPSVLLAGSFWSCVLICVVACRKFEVFKTVRGTLKIGA